MIQINPQICFSFLNLRDSGVNGTGMTLKAGMLLSEAGCYDTIPY